MDSSSKVVELELPFLEEEKNDWKDLHCFV